MMGIPLMLQFVILLLATWRISSLFTEEDGPFGIFYKLRISFKENSFFYDLLSCIYCISVWVGIFIAFSFSFLPFITLIVCFPLALSAGTCIIHSMAFEEMDE